MNTKQSYKQANRKTTPIEPSVPKCSTSDLRIKGNHNNVNVQSSDASISFSYKQHVGLLERIIALMEENARLNIQLLQKSN